ncbi:hypothetical protein MY8738_008738 [Beauveria namnaoensis]
MAVETGGTSETSLKRKATSEYFYLEIEGHYECGELLTKPSGKCQSKCDYSSAPCCPGRVSHAAVRQKAALHISDKIEPGFWSWTDQGPKRLNISVREGSCEEKRDALMAKIEPRHSNLKEKFDEAKAGQDPKLRTQSFQRILEAIELADENNRSSNLTLEQDVLFTCHAETFERKIRDGIATLRSASPEEQRSLFCRVVDYRANPSKSLCEIFDEDVAHTTSRNAKAQWLPKFSASAATVVARAHDAQFSESGIRDKEREIVRKSKLAHIVHQTINELIPARQVTNGPEGPIPGPVIGVNALIICSALNEKSCLFFEATRQIHRDSIPAFARHLARRLIDMDWSNLPATISVAFPLFLICWAMRKPFSEVCDILGLPNLARLSLDVTAQLDHAEKRWRIATQNWERMTRAEIKVARTQLGQDMQVSLGDLRRLCLDQSDAELMTAEVRPSENSVPDHDSSSQNVECAGEAGSVASDEGSLFMPFQPSIDSGYVSNVGSQQMHGSTLAAPLSGAFVVPSASSSRSNVQRDPAAAGVVQNLSREATSLDALASAASQACPSHHDGGSAISPQFSMATSAMPIAIRGSETNLAEPGREVVVFGETDRYEAPPNAALAAGNRHLPVLDSPSDEVAADVPPIGTSRWPHAAGQKRSAESEGSEHRLSRKRHNLPTMDVEHEQNTDLHPPIPEYTHPNNSPWELEVSGEHQSDRTLAIEETPGLGVFATASSRTAYNDTRDNDESNAPNDFSGLISDESVHVANTQGSPPAGKDGTNIASDVDSQTWNFSLNDSTLEDPQSWLASFDSMTNQDMQSLFNNIL